MIRLQLLVLAALSSLAVVSPRHAPRHPVAKAVDWSQVVSESGAGGFVMGKPDAKVKLIEYGSLTCPHCRRFDEQASQPLIADYVRGGRVTWEFRPFLLNGYDVPATLTARCNGPVSFFPLLHALYATQPDWVGKMRAVPDAQLEQIRKMPPERQFVAIGQAAGFPQFGAAHAVPAAKITACLGNRAAVEKAVAMTGAAVTNDHVTGTPAFFIDGQAIDYSAGPSAWDVVEARLKAAVAG